MGQVFTTQLGGGSGTGTVTSVSVATAQGFAGTVANPTTTPAITISTTVTGLLQGNGTSVVAATLGTGVLTALGVNVGSAGAFITYNGDAGTPSALVGTNITGTAAGLTAGSVTTNANLTGPITSTGNATAIASQTGTGSTFVMSAAPTITGAMAASGSLAIAGAAIGADVLAWTGTATGSGQLNAASFVPTSATVPTNGMYLSSANTVAFSSNSAIRFFINGTALAGNNGSSGQIVNLAASATIPTLIPNRGDTTTGIGAQASGNISLIVGAAEQARIVSTGITIISGKNLLLGNAATTGLTPGVLSATTNATIVISDSGGQAYRIPCII